MIPYDDHYNHAHEITHMIIITFMMISIVITLMMIIIITLMIIVIIIFPLIMIIIITLVVIIIMIIITASITTIIPFYIQMNMVVGDHDVEEDGGMDCLDMGPVNTISKDIGLPAALSRNTEQQK